MSDKGWVAILLCVFLILLASASQSLTAGSQSKPIPVRIGIVSRSTLDMPYLVARERGFFREEGLDAEIIFMRASLTVPAMLGRSIDFGTATGPRLALP